MDISKKKPAYPIQGFLRKYLWHYDRISRLPLHYDDLLRYSESFPVIDQFGNDTLWESVIYPSYMYEELNHKLTTIYAILRTDGDMAFSEHLSVDRIDYCTFGNSNPFRIRIINRYNDNYDYFYVKRADASRIYGLELEHLLSPNRINFLVFRDTLIEEHIAGIPGDVFIKRYLERPETNLVRVAKEFVKFNERCFVRLLGDMRAYNYVVDITPDFDNEQYRIRAIDFDQQSYEGRYRLYLPQFFKENNRLVQLSLQLLNERTIKQYQQEERTLIVRRLKAARYRLKDLIDCMRADTLAPPEKVEQLKQELAAYHHDRRFLACRNMGDIVRQQLRNALTRLH
ncbi:MAG: hypothetical protein KatS3mg033_2052 [Thermonema sp.]|uniref:hypothetical protein n=1 Tax=Thermonema sp. TaxID=2231181 RepID=UPI0021DC1127|nr:hypothetical protein [Thermonema sp.]GIV40252.1 MAG: hypothetical protein KatS3mg033_2052 [Thermonema sp.]